MSVDYISVSHQSSLPRVLLTTMLLFSGLLALLLHIVSAHERSDRIAYFSAELTAGNKCGPQRPITGDAGWGKYSKLEGFFFTSAGWTEVTTATARSWSGGTRTNGGFNTGTGIYTTPLRGLYHCCASFRCRQGGVCDFTIIRNTATFGGKLGDLSFSN